MLGVDPGLTGAIALWDTRTDQIEVRDMPMAEGEVSPALLAFELGELAPVELAWVERVASMPKQGVASTFKFGAAYGIALGVLAGLEIRTFRVTPAKWKTHMRLSRQDKNASRARAASLWPKQAGLFARVRDDGRAEAALLAYYGYHHVLCP